MEDLGLGLKPPLLYQIWNQRKYIMRQFSKIDIIIAWFLKIVLGILVKLGADHQYLKPIKNKNKILTFKPLDSQLNRLVTTLVHGFIPPAPPPPTDFPL